MSINLVPATLAVGPHQEKHWAKCDEKKGPKRVQKMLVDVAHGNAEITGRASRRSAKKSCRRCSPHGSVEITLLTKLIVTPLKYFPSFTTPLCIPSSFPQGDMQGGGSSPPVSPRTIPKIEWIRSWTT